MNLKLKSEIFPFWWSFTWRFLIYTWPMFIGGSCLIQLFHLHDFYIDYKPIFGGISGAINAVFIRIALKKASKIYSSWIADQAIRTYPEKFHADGHTPNIINISIGSLWWNLYLRLMIYNIVVGLLLKEPYHSLGAVRHYDLWISGAYQLIGILLIYIAFKQAFDACLPKMINAKDLRPA